jgi:hypothetical protein
MSDTFFKPKYLYLTEVLGLKIPFLWCLLATVVGLIFYETVDTISVPVLTLLMVYMCYKLACFFLSFQKYSGVVSDSVYGVVIKLIWFSSVIGFFISVFSAVFESTNSEAGVAFFKGAFSIVYFGFALAAANKWGETYVSKQ